MSYNNNPIKGKKKLLTTFLMSLWLVPLTIYGGIKVVDYPGRCALCHSMKPEYYTWQASTHGKAEVSCVSCHSPQGISNIIKDKLRSFKQIYYTVTDNYTSPIRIIYTVQDGACERCHDMNKRLISPSKAPDLKVPHKVHKEAGILCSKCHAGTAHGNIPDRKVSYAADYKKWNELLGKSMMSDPRYVRPQMETCMRCHTLRKATLKCKSCHPSGKLPATHKNSDFRNRSHGMMAKQGLEECNSCHGSMSDKPVEVFKEPEIFKQFLNEEVSKKQPSPLIPYARGNSFCRNCHAKRPPSHSVPGYKQSHGESASKDKTRCAVCHDNNAVSGTTGAKPVSAYGETVTLVGCSSCHPSSHSDSVQWQKGYHPYPIPTPPRLTRSCYSCHNETKCGKCHDVLK
ncbi:MAG: multiheme c-type cytochrome [Eubacteriales bacterium]